MKVIKVATVFATLLALGCAAIINSDSEDIAESTTEVTTEGTEGTEGTESPQTLDGGCLYLDELWGSVDGTKFYFCLPDGKTVIEQSCPYGTFFVRNSTVAGCLPLELVDTKCVYPTVEDFECTGENLQRPHPASEPTTFFLCPYAGAEPVEIPCPEGKAFVSQDGYLGCFEWTQWRKLRNCLDEDAETTTVVNG